MADQPAKHGHQHLPEGPDPIPGMDSAGGSDCCCEPPPGTLVRPTPMGNPETGDAPYVNVKFPGGVIAVHMDEFQADGLTSVDDSGAGTADAGSTSPSGRTVGIQVGTATGYDAADDCWVFRPVEDFGCEPGVLYGIWFSVRYKNKSGDLHLESQSDNNVDDADVWVNGGGRHPNASTTVKTIQWGDPTDQDEYPELPYYAMLPMGTQPDYGDWPLQGGGSSGIKFESGETITLKAWTESDTAEVWLDHLVMFPTFPLGMADATELDTGSENFSSSAREVIGYYPTSDPASITEPDDSGTWTSSAVDDSQELTSIFDPDMHWTIASHDESDIPGAFTSAVGGGVHVYVLCRSHNSGGVYSRNHRGRGHVTVFTGSQPIADIICHGAGAWTWAYAGKAPLGDGAQGAFGLVQWIGDNEVFWNNHDTDITSVRSSLIAYVPQGPCEADGFVTAA